MRGKYIKLQRFFIHRYVLCSEIIKFQEVMSVFVSPLNCVRNSRLKLNTAVWRFAGWSWEQWSSIVWTSTMMEPTSLKTTKDILINYRTKLGIMTYFTCVTLKSHITRLINNFLKSFQTKLNFFSNPLLKASFRSLTSLLRRTVDQY